MKLICVAVLLMAGCSRLWAVPTRPATLADVRPRCHLERVLGVDGQPIAFMSRSSCPLLGLSAEAVDVEVVRNAAPVGVMLERELILVALDREMPPGWRAAVVYFAASSADSMVESTKDDSQIKRVAARSLLTDADYAYLRGRAADLKEERAYAACRGFLADVAASSQDAARADACARLMAMVDRQRSMRQSADSQAIARENLMAERRQAAAMEAANSQRATEDISRALRRMAEPTMVVPPLRQTTSVTCHTYGATTNCSAH